MANTTTNETTPPGYRRPSFRRPRTTRFDTSRVALLVLLPALLVVGCVERIRDDEYATPLWERYDTSELSTKERGFVMHKIEVGGRIECTGDDYFHEQKTEVYARVLSKTGQFPQNVKRVLVRFEYLGGVLAGGISKKISEQADSAQFSETLKISLNGGAACPCVRVLGKMTVFDKHTPLKMTLICPEKA